MKSNYKIVPLLVLAVGSSFTLIHCNKDDKSNKRTINTTEKPTDGFYPDDLGSSVLVKADALGFNRSGPFLMEPTSCFGFDITILGGEDAFLAAIDQDTTLAVTSTSTTTEFFTDSQCQTKGNEIALPNGSSYGSLYAKDTNPGTFDLKVTAIKGATLKPAELKAISGKASKLKLMTLSQGSINVDTCEPVLLTLVSKDDQEVYTANPLTTTLTVTTGTGAFYDAEDCSGVPLVTKEIPKGNSDLTVFVKAKSTGPMTLQAAAAKDSGYENATLSVNVDPKI